MPGEISLAHNGILFLDELPEFSRSVLDVLREPLETGRITISRAARHAEFPSRFQLVAAMNPCPCGYHGDPDIQCQCGADQITRYQGRVSGPFLDRLDLHISLQRETSQITAMTSNENNESSELIRRRVVAAWYRQHERQGLCNAHIDVETLKAVSLISSSTTSMINQAVRRLNLSLRAQHRMLKVARTIADLENSDSLQAGHVAESLSYRALV